MLNNKGEKSDAAATTKRVNELGNDGQQKERRSRKAPFHPHDPCRTKRKVMAVILLTVLVILLKKEVALLMAVSPDRSILMTAPSEDSVPCGTFNNLEVIYRGPKHSLHSTAECIGESFSPDSWMYRSCLYRNLCFDVESNEFVLFQSHTNKLMESSKIADSHFISSSLNTSVSLGGFVWNWKEGSESRLQWSPTIADPTVLSSAGYYELAGDTVMIPFHTIAAQNIGHFMWDSLLPIYSLLAIFGLSESTCRLVLLRYILKGKPLAYTCEKKFAEGCERNFQKLLPLVGVPRSQFSSTLDYVLSLTHERKSNYVCSSHGAAGIGYLTDHGKASHGKHASDYSHMHNYGRGQVLFGFRNFILKNTDASLPSHVSSTSPIRITFSLHSSSSKYRNLDFASQIAALTTLPDSHVRVQAYQFSQLSMEEEIQTISRSSILITACGGGAVSSMFLPRGATLIVFYAEQKDRFANAKLDFDYLNNMGYVRTHWLPTKNMHEQTSLDSFVQLIKHELELISLQ